MWVYVNVNVMEKVGVNQALILEHIFVKAPHYNIKLKINVSKLTKELPISLSTVQRLFKELTERGYIIKHGKSVYSLSEKFFAEFEEYNNYIHY